MDLQITRGQLAAVKGREGGAIGGLQLQLSGHSQMKLPCCGAHGSDPLICCTHGTWHCVVYLAMLRGAIISSPTKLH